MDGAGGTLEAVGSRVEGLIADVPISKRADGYEWLAGKVLVACRLPHLVGLYIVD
jgi:hypothetical protein